jgi:hypothetical protein
MWLQILGQTGSVTYELQRLVIVHHSRDMLSNMPCNPGAFKEAHVMD